MRNFEPKVIHLATSDYSGGAAIAARRIHESLDTVKIDSLMLVRFSDSTASGTVQFQPPSNPRNRMVRIARRAHLAISQIRRRWRGGNDFERGPLTDPRSETLPTFSQLPLDGDLLHIHKVEGFVDWKRFLCSVPENIPVVVTLHDLSPLTGGCDYPGDCFGYRNACGSCPALPRIRSDNDFSTNVFRWKNDTYASFASSGRLCFVANSRWTAESAMSATLRRGAPVELIHFGINSNRFHPRDREAARAALGIPATAEVILAAAHDLGVIRKGAKHAVEAVVEVAKTRNITVLSFGQGILPIEGLHPNIRYRHFGSVASESLQGLLYRCADVFVVPSLEEAFGMTALEAIACGCMVVGFDVGGLRDIVRPPLNGRLVPRGSSSHLANAITELIENPDHRSQWIDQAEDWITENFSYSSSAAKHSALYRRLCKATPGNRFTST